MKRTKNWFKRKISNKAKKNPPLAMVPLVPMLELTNFPHNNLQDSNDEHLIEEVETSGELPVVDMEAHEVFQGTDTEAIKEINLNNEDEDLGGSDGENSTLDDEVLGSDHESYESGDEIQTSDDQSDDESDFNEEINENVSESFAELFVKNMSAVVSSELKKGFALASAELLKATFMNISTEVPTASWAAVGPIFENMFKSFGLRI